MNAVFKEAPWHPTVTGFDTDNTLSDIDSANLKSWGFNIVRLGVMWPGVEPGARGDYNQTYLDQIETIVTTLAKDDIYVILDFHQDVWHRKFCGEGVPDYVFDACVAAEPEGTAEFPLPAVNYTYPLDENGNPTLEACLSSMFATYYLSAEVGAGFQCLYDNKNNLWDAFAGYWVAVADRFKGFDTVLGYELINEPWAGDVYAQPSNLLPKVAEEKYLQPLYEYVHKAIRTVDDEKIIFFEGLTIDYWQNGFTQGPGGVEYNDRQVFAYHVYCPLQNPTVTGEIVCDAIDAEFLAMRLKDAARMGVQMVMTEFGAAEDIKGDMYQLGKQSDVMDQHQQSWMYWQFKYYQDLTTCTPEGEGMYQEDGNVCQDKLDVLSRTYPHAVAGQLNEFKFHQHTGKFEMNMTPLSTLPQEGVSTLARTTEIYVNIEQTYKNGVNVEVSGSSPAASAVMSVVCPATYKKGDMGGAILQLVQSSAAVSAEEGDEDSSSSITVTITNCGSFPADSCTCKF